VQASEFSLQNQGYTLLSLQDIRQELDEKEMESWQKLIRVLTHEIMNSVTPIISLSGVIHEYLADEEDQPIPLASIPSSHAEDMLQGIQTIERRSHGLLQFVKAYRNLTRIPPPEFEMVDLGGILQQILVLLKAELEGATITVETDIEASLSRYADAKLLEQVFINLIKNAMEAVSHQKNPLIRVKAHIDPQQKVVIQIQDNGPGIPLEIQDKLFIPFFSTKAQGSGIGLSLSQQIIRIHKGEISFFSEKGKGSVFTISL
ncbi:MAG: ATP-binding protein, partial [Bacteroidota bacterium]